MGRVAIVTDSASDLTADAADAHGIRLVPLIVSFGDESFRSGVDIGMGGFYERLSAPGAPFPTTAACSPQVFEEVFRELLGAGAEGVVCLTVGSRLSATHASAVLARDAMPGAPIRVVDSHTVSMAQGMAAILASVVAAEGGDLEVVAGAVQDAARRSRIYIALETLEYLRRGGRISAAQAAIGSILSVKPIITVEEGAVETVDRPRTRGRARARTLELLEGASIERLVVLHTMTPDVDAYADLVAARTGLPRDGIEVCVVGPTTAPHVGPGAYGVAFISRPT